MKIFRRSLLTSLLITGTLLSSGSIYSMDIGSRILQSLRPSRIAYLAATGFGLYMLYQHLTAAPEALQLDIVPAPVAPAPVMPQRPVAPASMQADTALNGSLDQLQTAIAILQHENTFATRQDALSNAVSAAGYAKKRNAEAIKQLKNFLHKLLEGYGATRSKITDLLARHSLNLFPLYAHMALKGGVHPETGFSIQENRIADLYRTYDIPQGLVTEIDALLPNVDAVPRPPQIMRDSVAAEDAFQASDGHGGFAPFMVSERTLHALRDDLHPHALRDALREEKREAKESEGKSRDGNRSDGDDDGLEETDDDEPGFSAAPHPTGSNARIGRPAPPKPYHPILENNNSAWL